MNPRTESTAKTGARRCEFWGGRGDCSGIYLYCVGICRLAHVGATIVLVDSQKENVEMGYNKLADAITVRTKVIVPVDIAGICADVDKVREYALTFPHGLNRQPDYLWLQIKNGVRNE